MVLRIDCIPVNDCSGAVAEGQVLLYEGPLLGRFRPFCHAGKLLNCRLEFKNILRWKTFLYQESLTNLSHLLTKAVLYNANQKLTDTPPWYFSTCTRAGYPTRHWLTGTHTGQGAHRPDPHMIKLSTPSSSWASLPLT